MSAIQFEGQWEDIVKHASELAGRRVRITILTDEPTTEFEKAKLAWLEETERLIPEPNHAEPSEFVKILKEKYRAQGLDL